MRRIPTAVLLVAAGALLAAGTALADSNGGLAPRSPASPGAEDIRDVYWLLVGIGIFVFAVVAIPLTVFLFRFRSRGRGREVEGPQIRGNSSLELGWTLGAVGIVTVLIAFVFYKLPGIASRLPARFGTQKLWITSPSGALTAKVTSRSSGRRTVSKATTPFG